MTFQIQGLKNDLAPFSRRAFLKSSIAAAVGTTAAITVGCSSHEPSPYAYLNHSDATVLTKLVETMFPDSEPMFPASNVPMLENTNHLLSFVPESIRSDLSAGITLFNYGAVILGLNLKPFTSLDTDDAVAYVNDWQNGNEIQRGLMSALKKILYTAYWRDSRTWAAVEFDGPVSDKWGLPSLGNAPLPQV